jgi:hypothetical protein
MQKYMAVHVVLYMKMMFIKVMILIQINHEHPLGKKMHTPRFNDPPEQCALLCLRLREQN